MTYQTYTNFNNKNEIIQTFWGEVGNYDTRSSTKYYVWEKPSNSKFTSFIVFGGGGGGGGGAAMNLGTASYGGNGGSAGGKNILFVPSIFLPKKLYIAVGNGGSGGAGGINSGSPAFGSSGTNGGNSLVSFIPIITTGINASALSTSNSRGLQVNHKLLFAGGGNGGAGGTSSAPSVPATDRGWSPLHYGTNNTGTTSPTYYGSAARHAINQFVGVPNNNSKFINNSLIYTRVGPNTTYQTAINENRLDTGLPGLAGLNSGQAGSYNSIFVNFYGAGGGAGITAAGAGGGVAAGDMLYGTYTYGRPATTSGDFGRNGTNFENNFKEINSNNFCNNRYAHHIFIHAGGQGGGSSATGTGGRGGDGAMSCGGGGGGGVIGSNTGGRGGDGGPGVVIITSIF